MRRHLIQSHLAAIKKQLKLEDCIAPDDHTVALTHLASLQHAQSGGIAFCRVRKKDQLEQSQASVIITTAEIAEVYDGKAHMLVHKDPMAAFVQLMEWFYPQSQQPSGRHPSAVCHPEAKIHATAWIDANAVIAKGAQIAADVCIGAGCYVGESVVIGQGSKLHAQVTIYHDCHIGERCIIHSGARIGSDGFGYVDTKPGWKKIPHIGRVVLGDEVEIGANTCIDRGMLDDTIIHKGTKMDNLIHIAHNVVIGENSALAGQSGIAGSTTIGKNFRLGGGSGINGQITITDNVIVGGGTNIISAIDKPGFYIGVMPAQMQKDWARSAIAIRKAGVKSVRQKT